MTFYKQRNLHDEPRQEVVEDLVCPADVDAPWYKQELSMAWNRLAALVYTRSLGFPSLRWQRTPDYSPSPLPFQQ